MQNKVFSGFIVLIFLYCRNGGFIVLPIACAYPFFQKYFVSGLTIGSVKE
jgi:ABC-type maltose transport system permease subunit